MTKSKYEELTVRELVDYFELAERVCGFYEKILHGNYALKSFEGVEFKDDYSKYTGIYNELLNESKKRLNKII